MAAVYLEAIIFRWRFERWPTYGHPDPGTVVIFLPLDIVAHLLFIFALVSPIVYFSLAAGLWILAPRSSKIITGPLIAILGYSLWYAWIGFVDPMGIYDWFMD